MRLLICTVLLSSKSVYAGWPPVGDQASDQPSVGWKRYNDFLPFLPEGQRTLAGHLALLQNFTGTSMDIQLPKPTTLD
jgi:hypothetical protein